MWCAACGLPGSASLCRGCRSRLHPASDRIVGPQGEERLLVRAAFVHEGTARELVHRLKYEGSRRAGRVLAEAMAEHIDPSSVIVPVPRTPIRRWRYGIDQAAVLADHLGALTGATVYRRLAAPLWQPRHAGKSLQRRTAVAFRVRGRLPHGRVVLVDDVVTTGSTLSSAAWVLDVRGVWALVATSADEVTSLSRRIRPD